MTATSSLGANIGPSTGKPCTDLRLDAKDVEDVAADLDGVDAD